MAGNRENAGLWNRVTVRHWPSYTVQMGIFGTETDGTTGRRERVRGNTSSGHKVNAERSQGMAQGRKNLSRLTTGLEETEHTQHEV